jgi:CDGSH-type Zn-finger protein
MEEQVNTPKIVIRPNGSYKVLGNVPLVHKTQVVSEYGEPLAWKKDFDYEPDPAGYSLCRCGLSSEKPFCDGTHRRLGFDGTETADPGAIAGRQETLPGGTHLVVRKDPSLCMESGFCGLREKALEYLVAHSDDTRNRSLAIAMVERCPSGSLTYAIEADQPEIEPDLPAQIAVTTEITAEGPIAGPLWVSGNITIERSDGQPVEMRNRVTLCNCGCSQNKPFCDGAHRRMPRR